MSDNKNNLHLEEGEHKILLEHSYDGIQELNHPLPSWWKFTFYAGIIFGTVYFVAYQFFGLDTLRQEFKKDYSSILVLQEKFNKLNGAFNEVKYNSFVADNGIKKGQIVFENNCMPCHQEKAKGDIGPNLTDEYWLWAKGTPETIYPVVFNGVPDNGMPTWSGTLTNDEIYQVVSYVQSLHHTHQPGGKAPQGNKIE